MALGTRSYVNSLFIFHFVLPILPWKRKTLYRKSRNLSDEKPKNEVTKLCDEPDKRVTNIVQNTVAQKLLNKFKPELQIQQLQTDLGLSKPWLWLSLIKL